jgi:AraC family transcriptional regulator, regulatory protein of adaptative response / methylated-DNA-[protein]-cysteine methyltransferase
MTFPQVLFLYKSCIDTPIGPMLAIGDRSALYLLEFLDRPGLDREIESLKLKTQSKLISECSPSILSIKKELALYFEGKLKCFQTRIMPLGSFFQKIVWETLQQIPFGTISSYGQIAKSIKRPSSFRAVASANRRNRLAIIIPCHRVIRANGNYSGYAGGVERKKWLINHEKNAAELCL